MVEFNGSSYADGGLNGIISIVLMSCGVVVSLFFGIKLRWFQFRYRMKIPSIEETSTSPVQLRSSSVKEVRENCSIGRYSYFEDNLTGSKSDYMPVVASSSSFNVTSKTKENESIFKWPFKSRMDLKKQHSFEEVEARPSSSRRRDKDLAMMEKNERLKKSIYERLNSSTSMPDLLQRDDDVTVKEKVNEKQAEIKIHTGTVVVDESTQFVTVDEIKMPKRPMRIKMKRAPSAHKEPPKIIIEPTKQEENEEEIAPVHTTLKPPTPPLRRNSRSNSLRASQLEIPSQLPPLVMPRRHVNQTYVPIESVDDSVSSDHEHPIKSILKTGDEHHNSAKVHHITFVNVPDSDSDEEVQIKGSESVEQDDDVWTRIDMHRNQLKRLQEMESVSRFDESDVSSQASEIEELPPLPKTPPPLADELPNLREYSFA